MKKILLFAAVWGLVIPQFSAAETGHLVISQIQVTGGPGHTAEDFIELYNPTAADVDIRDWKLSKTTSVGTESSLGTFGPSDTATVVKAHGFYLWANANFTGIAAVPDASRSYTVSDNNTVSLLDNTGAVVDSFSWTTGPADNPGPYGYIRTNNAGEFNLATTLLPRNSASPADPPLAEEPLPAEPPPPAPEPEPALPPVSSGGAPAAPSYSSAVIISEFIPNPEGADGGEEWVELFSSEAVNLAGWKLDDEGPDGVVGSSAYALPENAKISAGQFLVIMIPEGKFALNNSGGDALRLIWPNNLTAAAASYEGSAPEGMSFARNPAGEFAWTEILTDGAANQFSRSAEAEEILEEETVPAEPVGYSEEIVISELLPYPEKGAVELIELQNLSGEEINLKNWVLADGSSKHKILEGTLLPHGFLIFNKTETKLALNNFGAETVMLKNPRGEIVDQMEYQDSPKGQSLNRVEGEEAIWSVTVTPGAANSVKSAIAKPLPLPPLVAQPAAEEELLPLEEEVGLGISPAAGLVAGFDFTQPGPVIASSPEPRQSPGPSLLWPALSFVAGIIICYSYLRIKPQKII